MEHDFLILDEPLQGFMPNRFGHENVSDIDYKVSNAVAFILVIKHRKICLMYFVYLKEYLYCKYEVYRQLIYVLLIFVSSGYIHFIILFFQNDLYNNPFTFFIPFGY